MKALVFVALVLACIFLLTRWGDDRSPLAVELTPATYVCTPTIPSRLTRKDTRSLT